MNTKIRRKGKILHKEPAGPPWWDILTTNYPLDFAKFRPKKSEEDFVNDSPEYIVDDRQGRTMARGFQNKRQAKEFIKTLTSPPYFIRIYHPRVKDVEQENSDRRQRNRINYLSSGRSK